MAPKRKSETSNRVSKKTKVKTLKKDDILDIEEIEKLGSEIISSSKNYNHLVLLLNQYNKIRDDLLVEINSDIEKAGRQLSLTLFKVFKHLMKEESLMNKRSYGEKKALIVKWLIDKYELFKNSIFEFIELKLASNTSLQLDLLEIILKLIKCESQYMKSGSNDLYFPTLTYKKLVEALLVSKAGKILPDGTTDNFIVLEFTGTFKDNWDLQFYFVNNLSSTLEEWKESKDEDDLRTIFSNFYTIMKTTLLFNNDSLEDLQTYISQRLPSVAYKALHFKTQFQNSFIKILSYPLSVPQYKSTLLILHKKIIPYMNQPQALMDFLTDAYNITEDEVIPILTLNSLYELMKNYNLEYPDFYTKLYSLLTPSLLYTRYRSRYFRLCDLFLTSTHLSANLIASFIKKLARLSLTASASGVVIVIPFIYNLLKRHPTCMIMLHNTAIQKDYQDKFDFDEKDPLRTGAIESSLWELETLMSHYHPNIATLAKVFGEPFRKHSYNLEDFLDWSYISLLESESTRKYKGMAALEFEEYSLLFDNAKSDESQRSYVSGWTI